MKESKPRWEKKYEEYTSQSAKYAKMKRALKTLKEGKVTGDFKTKQEYQEAVDKRANKIADYEKELKGYENFKKNKDKIQNILEYRNELIEKLNKLPKVRNEEETASLNNKKKEQEVKAQRISQYQKEIDDLKQELKNDLSDSDRQILLLTLKARMDSMGILQEEQANLRREIANLEEVGKDTDEETQRKTATYERKIAKCNIIAANLLKGKELGEFEIKVVPEDKKFKSNDGKLSEEVKKARYEHENDKQNVVETAEKSEDNAYNAPEIIDDEIENAEEDKAIAEVSDFATKYPTLAKAGNFFKNIGNRASSFFKNIGSKLSDLFKRNDAEKLEKVDAEVIEETDKKEDLFEEIDENVKAQIEAEKEEGTVYKEANVEDKENEMLKAIAEKGKKEAFRAELASYKQQAANKYAEKYGGRYEGQDGATTKQEKQANDEER